MDSRLESQVAITGIGIVSALGHDLNSFWDGALQGRTAVEEVPEHWSRYYKSRSRIWSPLPRANYTLAGLRRAELLSYDATCLNAVYAATEALAQASCSLETVDSRSGRSRIAEFESSRCGAYMGTGLGCITSSFQNYVPHLMAGLRPGLLSETDRLSDQEALIAHELLVNLDEQPRVLPIASVKSMGSSLSASLSLRFGLRGPNETCLAACASGLLAITHGYEAIACGRLDAALVGGSEFYGDRAGGVFMAFDRLGTLVSDANGAPTQNCPFDKRRSGFLFSQGAACVLLLERKSHALARGARPICVISGAGVTSDAYSLVAMSSDDNAINTMLNHTLRSAGVSSGDVQYVNAHGTGTVQNDEIEAGVIEKKFTHGPYVNSTKSLLGHTIGACGAIEAAVVAMSIHTGQLHPTVGLVEPVRDLNFTTSRISATIDVALTQNFGFGGHNVGLVLSRT